MVSEAKRNYDRQWRHDNPDKMREYHKNTLRRKYLAEFLAERQKQPILGKKEVLTNGKSIPT